MIAASLSLVAAMLVGVGDNTTKVWVFFEDKGPDAVERVGHLAETYPPRAIQRRKLRRTAPGLFDERDLPVWEAYVDRVEALGAEPVVRSRWLNAVSVRADSDEIDALKALACVRSIQPVRAAADPGLTIHPSDIGHGLRDFYGYAQEQTEQIDMVNVHNQGYTGAGVIVGILDTGFEYYHEAFHSAEHPISVLTQWDFVNDDADVGYEPGDDPDQHVHGTLILGTLAAYRPNEFVGMAYDAQYILAKTEDITSETQIEEDYYVAGLEFIELNGGDMATSSLGYIDWYTQGDLDGQTAVTTIAVNAATANGVHCLSAAGNSGHDSNPGTSHLIAPTDAFQIISCGAVDSAGNIAGFSSDGPTADGRVKPELLARGVDTYTLWPYDSSGYASASGTSLSTPLLAGVVATLTGAHPDWTVDQMRDMLFTYATDFVNNGTFDPIYVRGYGIAQAGASLNGDCNNNGIPDVTDIATGTSTDYNANGVPDDCEGCLADFNGDGTVNSLDFIGFLNAFTAGDPAADFNGDGAVNSTDFIGFLNAFVAGC